MHFWADPSRCRLVGRAMDSYIGPPARRGWAPYISARRRGCWLLLPSRPSARLHADRSDAVTTHRRSAALRRQVPCPSHTSLCPLQSASYDKSSSSDQASVLRRDGGDRFPKTGTRGKLISIHIESFCLLYAYCTYGIVV